MTAPDGRFMLLTLSAENSWHLYFFMIRILVTDPCLKVLYITPKDKSSRLHITPPLLSLSGYGSKSPVKCCVVIPLLSLLWSIYRPPHPHRHLPPLPAAFKTKEAAHDHKRESHLWNVLIMWPVQHWTICLITSNWFSLTVKASALGNTLCCAAGAAERSNFSDAQLSQLTAKDKTFWLQLNLGKPNTRLAAG